MIANYIENITTGLAGGRRLLLALLAVLAGALVLTMGLAAPAKADLSNVGPVNPDTNVPFWYDASGLRLDLCFDTGPTNCLAARSDFVPPDGEAFYYNATATTPNGSLVEMATEAAFAPPAGGGPDEPVAFNRLRIRADVTRIGTYTVTYPYGTKTYVVNSVGDGKEINDTQDVGCLTPPCGDFAGTTASGDGGIDQAFLKWDPDVGPAAPNGFIGDGLTPHKVVGSPITDDQNNPQNYVKIERVKDGAGNPLSQPELIDQTDLFAVQGKIARPAVVASPAGGPYKDAQTVKLVSSEPGADIYYTLDGADPADADGNVAAGATKYTDTFQIAGDATLKAVVVDPATGKTVTDPVANTSSGIFTEKYIIDGAAPSVSASPAGGSYGSAQSVRLTATDNKDTSPKTYYTTDGTDPSNPDNPSRKLYGGPVSIDGNIDGTPVDLKFLAVDAAGNSSAVSTETYQIAAPDVSADPGGGSYNTLQSVQLTATDPDAEIFYTTDGTDPDVNLNPDGTVESVVNGTRFVDPIKLDKNTALKFLATSAAGKSSVHTENYIIDIPANRAKGNLEPAGPVDSSNGFPFWYGDKGSSDGSLNPVRLELCLDANICPVAAPLPDPTKPMSFPKNFPDEGFWWSGDASIDRSIGGKALLVMSQEAAFTNGPAQVGQQISFARIRVRIDNLVPGETYTVTHPYGVEVLTADDKGLIFHTEDIGCLGGPCDFDLASDGRIGPFLRWDPGVAPAAPEGFIGNPLVNHKVVGSPNGTNFFKVEGPDAGGPGVDTMQTDLFAVQGKIAELRATASPKGGLYNEAQNVRIQASFPKEAKIVYTTDGTDPSVAADTGAVTNGTEYVPDPADPNPAATVNIDTTTTLKFMAVDLQTNKTSEIYTRDYRIDTMAPTVSATPDPQSGPFNGGQTVTLTANDPKAPGDPAPKIFYTTGGTDPELNPDGTPAAGTSEYTEPLKVSRSETVSAVAVDAAGNMGSVANFDYVIHNLKAVGPVDSSNGFPFWYEDFGLGESETAGYRAPLRMELCLDPAVCPVAAPLPDPNSPISFPGNFPDEGFWWYGEANMDIGASKARMVLATEAAFGTAAGAVEPGQQVSFSRIRTKITNLEPGAEYRITHPYGVETVTADDRGILFATEDLGCLTAPCDFKKALDGRIGPFLTWDTFGTDSPDAPPAGFVGDGATPHKVVGSPFDTNLFKVEQIADGAGNRLPTPRLLGETDQFIVQGKIAEPKVTASPEGGLYNKAQSVTLAASESGSNIYYTKNGDEPTTASPTYATAIPVDAEGDTTLKFMAVDAAGAQTPVRTEKYTIDTTAPTLGADPAGGTFTSAQSVTLTSPDPDATIYYTTDGTTPSATSAKYTAPIQVNKSQTIRAIAVDPAGNASTPLSETYTITLTRTSISLAAPSPATLDFRQTTTLSGTLLSGGAPLANTPVTLEQKPVGVANWRAVPNGDVTTDASGKFSLAGVRPTQNTDYRARFAGDARAQASTSVARRVNVRVLLSLNAPTPNPVNRGKNLTLSGQVLPAHPGSVVTLTISQNGAVVRRTTATLTNNGTYRVVVKAPGRVGTYSVQASFRSDADHLGDTSTRNLRVIK